MELTWIFSQINQNLCYQRIVSIHPAATAAVILLAIILAIYTLSLHVIFIVLRHYKSVKADSFTISHFMFSGCYLILIRVLLLAVEFSRGWETESVADAYTRNVVLGVICNINEWLNSIGIALIMGTLCGKLWRMYRLFNYFDTKRFLVSDFTLISFTQSVVSVNLLFLFTWTTFDPLLADFHQENIEYNSKDEPIIMMRVYCRCEHYSIWFSLAYLLNFIVVICVVILSSLNRHINRKHFQMSKSDGVSDCTVMLHRHWTCFCTGVIEHSLYLPSVAVFIAVYCEFCVCVYILSSSIHSNKTSQCKRIDFN